MGVGAGEVVNVVAEGTTEGFSLPGAAEVGYGEAETGAWGGKFNIATVAATISNTILKIAIFGEKLLINIFLTVQGFHNYI